MAVLEKIRVQMGVFITVIIGLALLSFIIDPNTFQSAVSMFSSKYDVGKMSGKAISYQDYSQRVEHQTNIQQRLSGVSNLDERGVEMVQQTVWQDLTNELILFPAIKKAGIGVGAEELFDLTQGREISPVLQQVPNFFDEVGMFSRTKLIQFVQSIESDPSGLSAIFWQLLESKIIEERLFSKYFALISKSTILNPIELRRSVEEHNVTSDVRFIMMPISFGNDTTISVTNQEIKDYYEKRKSLYEQGAARDIDYVQFTVVPSLLDIERAEADAQRFFEEFSTTKNMRQFLARNSDKVLDPTFYAKGELASISPILEDFAFKANMTDVLPLTREADRFFSARLESVKMIPDSAFVHLILLSASDKQLADSLVGVIKKGGDFETLAAQYSQGGRGERPGELGWITSQMFGGLLDTCLTAPINIPFTHSAQNWLHVLKVTKQTKPHKKVQLAVYEKGAIAGKETFQTYYSQANELVTKSNNKAALFTETARENNWPVFPAMGIVEGAKTVANITNARELSRWAFEAKLGEVSPIITIDNKYFVVATLTGVQEKGFAPLATKRMEIEFDLRREKEVKKIAETLGVQMKGVFDIEELGEITKMPVSRQTGIAFGGFGSRQLDPAFIGAVSGAPQGLILGPVEGSIGAYVFTVDDRQAGAYFTQEDALMQQQQMLGQQQDMIVFALTKAAKVEDNRGRFF
ncbi:MAG: SurA N-terminal domain-containing protein [Prevotellaceae bacterium]|jgi:peptidyl-prolyl cis-trans isomerase D|nr:SurA N-terminal domain-containing protein [Prevotellaceae bacterium]